MAAVKKIVRVWVSLDRDAYKEIAGYAKDAGMKVTQFLNMVSLMGARQFARTASPEKFLTPELLEQIVKFAGAEDVEIKPVRSKAVKK